MECGDDIKRQLFPAVFILSADFEEQYVVLSSFEFILTRKPGA